MFRHSGNENWKEKWDLDGNKATVSSTPEGTVFTAGPEAWNDTHHAVLWAEKESDGPIKVEYDYTRLDEATAFVTIIYLQASGSGCKSKIENSYPKIDAKQDLVHISDVTRVYSSVSFIYKDVYVKMLIRV